MQVTKILRNLGLILLTAIVFWLGIAMLVYSPRYVYRTVFWQGSDSFDWQKFPNHPLTASADPYHFAEAPDPRVEEIFEEISGAEGDKGQFIYVSPQKNLVMVRNGIEYDIPSEAWLNLFYEFASRY